jgi:pimeloyl-ACP methyl ester carboxylesterase
MGGRRPMKISANGIEMSYELSGQGNCLVLIHGFGDNLNMWYHQVPDFSKQYRVLTYDVRGFGQTEMTKGSYSMRLLADDLYELLKVLEIKSACVLGYSMGGMIALNFALRHPDVITGLIFANSAAGDASIAKREERQKRIMHVLQQGNIEVISEMMTVGSFSPDFKKRNQAEFNEYKKIKMQNDPSSYIAIMEALSADRVAPPDVRKVTCPVLIIAGDKDSFTALDLAESMKNSIKDAVLKVLSTGHAAAIEAPKEFNQVVLDFMNKLRGHNSLSSFSCRLERQDGDKTER